METMGSRRMKLSAMFFLILSGIALGVGLSTVGQFGTSADLVVEELILDPVEPEPDAETKLIATIANRGREPVSQSFSVFFEVDGTLVANRRVFRLGSDQKVEVSALWNAEEGEHRLRVRVDPFHEIPESNENNNTLEISVEVRRLEGIYSVTLGLLESLAQGLEGAGQALQVPPSDDLFQLFEAFKEASTTAGEEFSGSSGKLYALGQILPPSLSSEEQIGSAEQAASLYQSMADSFAQVTDGLNRLNLQLLSPAFEEIQSDLAELAIIAIEGVSLAGLGETVTLMDQVIEKTEELQAAASGTPGVDVDAAVQDLLGVLAQIGERWVSVGEQVVQSGSSKAARFTDEGGRPVSSYHAGEELRISVSGAEQLILEIFNSADQLVFSSESAPEQAVIIWKGTDQRGAPLPPDRYFYRLTINGSSDGRVELGWIILSE